MKNKSLYQYQFKAFTLIELLIVISVILVLTVTFLVALNPAKRLADTRDARRAQDIGQLLTGIHECAIDKQDNAGMSTCLGTYTTGNTYEIVSGAITSGCQDTCTGATSDSSCLRLDVKLADYFTSLPHDPSVTATGHTGYSIKVLSNGMTVIEACGAENGTIITSR